MDLLSSTYSSLSQKNTNETRLKDTFQLSNIIIVQATRDHQRPIIWELSFQSIQYLTQASRWIFSLWFHNSISMYKLGMSVSAQTLRSNI